MVFSGVLLGDLGNYQRGAATVAVWQENAVLESSVGLLMEPHWKQHILIQGFIFCHLGPFHPDADIAEGWGVRVVELAGQRDVVTEES